MIAVLDDDEPVRKAVLRLLRSAGYAACGFTSGQDLLASWASVRPDCVVLDLQMPGLSGLDVHRRLSAGGARVPTIMITASDEQGVLENCLVDGASTCLRKPLEAHLLLAAIARARIHPECIPTV
jgi:FixJ family two-component response regulator